MFDHFRDASSAIPAVQDFVQAVGQAFDELRHKPLAAYPTANVTQVPIATHQVKATCVPFHKYSSIANPQSMPTIAPL
jgi:hypothetical protein